LLTAPPHIGLGLSIVLTNNLAAETKLFVTTAKKETYKKLYLECCCLWIRNTDRRGNEERVVNGFETWGWRGMLKIKWADRITNGEVFQRAK
jgi:hypothetical protein